MSLTALSPGPLTRAANGLNGRLWALVVLGGAFTAASVAVGHPVVSMAVLVSGLTFLAITIVSVLLRWRYARAQADLQDALTVLVADDDVATVVTGQDGAISYMNAAAVSQYNLELGAPLAGAFQDLSVQPASLLFRLQNKALALGHASEAVVRPGGHLKVSARRAGQGRFVWRMEPMANGKTPGHSGDAIGLPMLTASKTGTVLFMNEAMRRLLGGRETTLDRVFTDLPLRPGEIHIVQGARGIHRTLVTEVELSAGRREIYLVPEPARTVMEPEEWGVLEGLPVPLLKLDPSGRVSMANARARALLGRDNILGEPMANLVEGLGRPLMDWLGEAWSGRNLGRTETVRATMRETETFLQISLDLVQDAKGDALVVVLNDATELKELERQFVQSQKMQAIGQLAGGVAHDFNNLLTAISGHCDLLLLRHDETDADYADLRQISQNSNRAAALVGQLLAFSRKQTLRPEVIDLDDTMSDLVHLLGRLVGEQISLDYTHDHEVRPIRADKRQLEQVVMNLVVNARDAMPGGGRIVLDLRNVYLETALERDRVRLEAGDYVSIRVVDSGHGISPDKLQKIFEPFFTTKGAGKGTGLGLSMAYGIVKQSGGFIFVDSVEGTGTTFTLYFPVHKGPVIEDALQPVEGEPRPEVSTGTSEAEIDPIEPTAPQSDTDLPAVPRPTHDPTAHVGGRVLLVEDEAPVRAFAARALNLRGYEVTEADSAETALDLLSDPELEIDVVVTDVIMPGMDGPTWVAQALEDRPGVRVVFVSGYSEESVTEHQKRIPNSVFLPKPFSLSELTATVAAQIH